MFFSSSSSVYSCWSSKAARCVRRICAHEERETRKVQYYMNHRATALYRTLTRALTPPTPPIQSSCTSSSFALSYRYYATRHVVVVYVVVKPMRVRFWSGVSSVPMIRRHPTKSIINGVVARDKRTTGRTTTFASSAPHSSASQHQNREREREEFDGTTSPPGRTNWWKNSTSSGPSSCEATGKRCGTCRAKTGPRRSRKRRIRWHWKNRKQQQQEQQQQQQEQRRRRLKTVPGVHGREIQARR